MSSSRAASTSSACREDLTEGVLGMRLRELMISRGPGDPFWDPMLRLFDRRGPARDSAGRASLPFIPLLGLLGFEAVKLTWAPACTKQVHLRTSTNTDLQMLIRGCDAIVCTCLQNTLGTLVIGEKKAVRKHIKLQKKTQPPTNQHATSRKNVGIPMRNGISTFDRVWRYWALCRACLALLSTLAGAV